MGLDQGGDPIGRETVVLGYSRNCCGVTHAKPHKAANLPVKYCGDLRER
jgi:hypothetical protein